MKQWDYPATWRVGDALDADTLNGRIRDPNIILLRRPLTVASSTVNQTIPTAGHGNTNVNFDTIEKDDDGMVMQTGTVTDFYAQRAGTYRVWFNVQLGTPSTATSCMAGFLVNGTDQRWQVQRRFPGWNGLGLPTSIAATFFMNVGEYITPQVWNGGASTVNLVASNKTPRLCIMWLGIT